MPPHQRELQPTSVRTYALPPVPAAGPAAASVRVVYACPHCAQPLRLRPEYFGRPLACKRCDRTFVPSLARTVTSLPGRPASEAVPARAPGCRRAASG